MTGTPGKILETDFDVLRSYNFCGEWGDKFEFVRIPRQNGDEFWHVGADYRGETEQQRDFIKSLSFFFGRKYVIF